MRLTLLALSVATLAGGCASTPPEADPVQLKLNDLDARITRIERIVANQVEVAQHVDEVQSTVRQLRGRLEELEHGNEALAKQQRDLYADLDKRLAAAGGAATAGPAAGVPAAGSATGETAAAGAAIGRAGGVYPGV
jgi:TolA-binding protein